MDFTRTIVALAVVMAIAWRFLGSYMVSVYEGRARWLSVIERIVPLPIRGPHIRMETR